MHDITVLVIIKNAEATLDACLSSVEWADDIFCVIDPNSTDGSHDIARQHTSRVVEHEFINSAKQRNWAIPQIETEWTLVLDSDEWLDDTLKTRVQEIIKDPSSLDGYWIKRNTIFFGKMIKHCGWHRDYNLRLFRTRKGLYDSRHVHASLEIDGDVGRIHEFMFHDTYRSFDDYLETMGRYTTWGAEDLIARGRKFRVTDLVFRPPLRFLKMYILHHGIMDGFHGFLLCSMASYSVLMKYAKHWHLERTGQTGATSSVESESSSVESK